MKGGKRDGFWEGREDGVDAATAAPRAAGRDRRHELGGDILAESAGEFGHTLASVIGLPV